MGSTRLRARLQRVAVASMTSALLVGGFVLAAEPAAAVGPSVASATASVASLASAPTHSSIVQMPARDTDADQAVDTRAAAPIALVSGALLVVVIGGIALDMRRRRDPRVSE